MVIERARRRSLLTDLGDAHAELATRIHAADALAESDDVDVLDALIALAKDASAPHELQAMLGRSLARICFRRARDLDEVLFALMREASGEAYDTEMGRLERERPDVRIAHGIPGSGR